MPLALLFLVPAVAVAAFLLKVAVGLADRMVGSGGRPRVRSASGYAFLPDRPTPPPRPGIPMPSLVRAVGIHLVAACTLLGIGLVVWLAEGRPAAESPQVGAAQAVPPVIGFFYFAAVAALMLPTSFSRSCLVTFLHALLCLAILVPLSIALYTADLISLPWVPKPSELKS